MNSFFIAGTGTSVGKTFFTCMLAYQLRRKGHDFLALKPVISGFDEPGQAETDTGKLLAAQGLPVDRQHIERISPWRFAAPLSVDMAAADEGKALDFQALMGFCEKAGREQTVLIESAGGLCSPLDARHTMLDWAAALGLPVILVAGSYLGTLSHTISAVRLALSQGIRLQAVILSESADAAVPLLRTVESLRRFLPESLSVIPLARLDSRAELWKYGPDVTRYFL